MNTQSGHNRFSLVREMQEVPNIIAHFDRRAVAEIPAPRSEVLVVGEGSSRIFPAKRLMYQAAVQGFGNHIVAEGGEQSMEYRIKDATVFVISNSGRTAECVRLLDSLQDTPAVTTIGITAIPETPVAELSSVHHVLKCGAESAVAATKSVVEQALFLEEVFRTANARPPVDLEALSDQFRDALLMPIPESITDVLASARTLYFGGRNNGVAEELALKTNEICRKPSYFLEGTYAVHGIEEVMAEDEVVVLIDPFEDQEDKFHQVLCDGAGMTVVAVSDHQTRFPTVIVSDWSAGREYVQLAVGWNLLVEAGIRLEVDLDHPRRARKIGNDVSTTNRTRSSDLLSG